MLHLNMTRLIIPNLSPSLYLPVKCLSNVNLHQPFLNIFKIFCKEKSFSELKLFYKIVFRNSNRSLRGKQPQQACKIFCVKIEQKSFFSSKTLQKRIFGKDFYTLTHTKKIYPYTYYTRLSLSFLELKFWVFFCKWGLITLQQKFGVKFLIMILFNLY